MLLPDIYFIFFYFVFIMFVFLILVCIDVIMQIMFNH